MRLHARLEEVKALRAIGIGGHFLAARVAISRHVADEWHHVAEELHQALHAHVLVCVDTENGEHVSIYQSLANAEAQLVLSKRVLVVEKFLHQRVIVFGGSLYQSVVQFLSLIHLFGGYGLTLWLATIRSPRQLLHYEHVDEAVEVWTGLKRILNLYAFVAINLVHLRD